MRSIRSVVVALAGMLLLVGVAPPASGLIPSISMQNYYFSPVPYSGTLGGTVQWHNNGPSQHQPVQDAPLALWTMMPVASGADSHSVTLFAAGTFAYHCQIHPIMKGTVRVPVTTDISSGAVGATIKITLASRPHPQFTFNVQRRLGTGTWVTFKTGVTALAVTFKATVRGSHQFRAKLLRRSNHAVSLWSPPTTVSIS